MGWFDWTPAGALYNASGLGDNQGPSDPFGKQGQAFSSFLGPQIQDLFSGSAAGAFAPNYLQNAAAQGLMNFNPMSYFAGAYGGQGGAPSGGSPIAKLPEPKAGSQSQWAMRMLPNATINQAITRNQQKNAAAASPVNPLALLTQSRDVGMGGGQDAKDLLSKTIGGGFTDPNQNPFYAQQAQGATSAAQKFLNQQMDQIRGGAQLASGGVAASSVLPQMQSQAAQNVSTDLGAQLAALQGQIYGQERGFQSQAMGAGLNLPFQQADLLASLSNMGANQAMGFGQLGLQQNQLLAALGGQEAGQSMAGAQFPYDMALKYLAALRGIPAGPSQLGQLLGGGGQFMSGLGALAAA